ncbi:MAG TPA: galactokinase [Bacteroidales bacterium]|nr:galactokinase [Bacteroidales bacterium]
MEKVSILLEKISQGQSKVMHDLYGSNAIEQKRQAGRYKKLLERFSNVYGHQEAMLFSSPGRTEIGGNHTDHNHGRVLAGAVNLDNIAVVAPNGLNMVRISSEGYEPFEVDLKVLQPVPEEKYTSLALVRGICSRLKELGHAIGGFDACIDGEVPNGSGLSSSACFEVLIGAIVNHLFNDAKIDPIEIAIVGQYAENQFFGKPCGLMDQTACSVGGLVTIDFENPKDPIVKKVDFDFTKSGYALVITNTGGSHANLNDEYASLPNEMKLVAAGLGATVLRQVTMEKLLQAIPTLREKVGDRAILRSIHFQGDNARVVQQVEALEQYHFAAFLKMVIESGYSSFMYNQNIFPIVDVFHQGVALGLALSHLVLDGEGAWRVHGGGFAGTIQAFVPQHLLEKYVATLEPVFGKGACHILFIRNQGAVRVEV